MLEQYYPVIMQTLVALGFAATSLALSVLLGKKGRRDGAKDTVYECGMLPVGDGSPRFSVKFYMVAMLFVLFDIEVVFSYSWGVIFRELIAYHSAVLWSMFAFFGVLAVAYVYALKKGALSWNE